MKIRVIWGKKAYLQIAAILFTKLQMVFDFQMKHYASLQLNCHLQILVKV